MTTKFEENPTPSVLPTTELLSTPTTHKTEAEFRDYSAASTKENERILAVKKFYEEQHTQQTLEYVLGQKEKLFGRLTGQSGNCLQMDVWEAIDKLDLIVDDSDPDTALPQSVHAFQTAESIRADPNLSQYDWLPLIGLIHDLGKVMLLVDKELPQWSVVGDTFPVGCAFEDSCIYFDSFKHNPDNKDPKLSTKLGIYTENCGFEKVHLSYGHDEYLYHVLKANNCTIPDAGLFIIRFHSFYPFHNKNGYSHLASKEDHENLQWLKLFQKHDLYSKLPVVPDVKALKSHYHELVKKYFPNPVLKW